MAFRNCKDIRVVWNSKFYQNGKCPNWPVYLYCCLHINFHHRWFGRDGPEAGSQRSRLWLLWSSSCSDKWKANYFPFSYSLFSISILKSWMQKRTLIGKAWKRCGKTKEKNRPYYDGFCKTYRVRRYMYRRQFVANLRNLFFRSSNKVLYYDTSICSKHFPAPSISFPTSEKPRKS